MKPVVLCILDGLGLRNEKHGNAFKQASTPTIDYLLKEYPNSLLEASGEAVGLPKGQMGNSEVGHQNIGAGRTVYQQIQIINNAIDDKSFYSNRELLNIINYTKENKSKLHLIGLVSDGGVHSKMRHLYALLDLCKKEGLTNVYIHVLTDGRDTLPKSAGEYISELEEKIKEIGIGTISSIGGRYYGMDRDNRYDRVKKHYDVLTGTSSVRYNNYKEALKDNYNNDITDEFIIPGITNEEGLITDNDGVIFFNFRPDRLRELGSALSNTNFNGFNREKEVNIKLTTMMPVSDEVISKNSFNLINLANTLGEYISNKGCTQLRIAETEKYAHVTYYFDGGVEKDLKGAKRILIPSPKVAYYDSTPCMSAIEITNTLIDELPNHDLVILNYANGDMVGHTGNIEAAIKAVECLDKCLKELYDKVKQSGGTLLVTADHGNCEYMLDNKDNIITSHTTNKVFFIVCDKKYEVADGKLGDIAPTILKLMNLDIPKEMTGEILI